MNSRETQDQAEIRVLIENWAIWRDSAQWDRLRSIWHDDGRMIATWFNGGADDFVSASRAGWERGAHVSHFLGGSNIEVSGLRSVAQTKMSISQRADCEGVLCDCTCWGRFFDCFESRDGEWGLVVRRAIYEKDRIDPVDSSQKLQLDKVSLKNYPPGYRHFAYLQQAAGMTVANGLPGLRGEAVEALYRDGVSWLAGQHGDH
jgi:hypothetical protein